MKPCLAVLLVFLISSRFIQAAAPENDNFSHATLLTGTNLVVSGSNVGATWEVGEPVHAGNPGERSVWWVWTAPASGSLEVQTTGSSFDTLLAAYTGSSYGNINVAADNDDFGSFVTSRIDFNVDRGTPYHIAIDGFDGQTGDIQLELVFRPQRLSPAPNDDFQNRSELRGTAVTLSTGTFFATKQPGEPDHARQSGGASLWWTWTAPVSGPVEIDTSGSDFDTLLAAYSGSVLTNLTVVASNDDATPTNSTSQVRFNAVGGSTYLLAVDGFDGATGNLVLHLLMPGVIWFESPQFLKTVGLSLVATAPPGYTYLIEASADLQHWQSLTSLTNLDGTVKLEPGPGPLSAHQFYRAKQDSLR